MSIKYVANINMDGTQLLANQCTINESYNAGWSCNVYVHSDDSSATLSNLLGYVINTEILEPGKTVLLMLGMYNDSESSDEATILRTWPCVVNKVRSQLIKSGDDISVITIIHLVDPVTYLSARPIWGAYRLTSLGEIIGGVLSMAAGGSGLATLNPMLTGLPPINITTSYRPALEEIPYAIATGETVGTWLDDVAGRLGVRFEMLGESSGTVQLMINDDVPNGEPLKVNLGSPIDAGVMSVNDYSKRSYQYGRGYVLDDPGYGGIRNLGYAGAVGRLIAGYDIGLDEAQIRVNAPLTSGKLESFQVGGESRQAGCRPGRIVEILEGSIKEVSYNTAKDLTKLQLTNVEHQISGEDYRNNVYMVSGDQAWHPMPPPYRSPVLVGATIDSGEDYEKNALIPRDHLGRIFVHFPFIPNSVLSEDGKLINYEDTNNDMKLTLDDFSAEAISDYEESSKEWEEKLSEHEQGKYDDPYQGKLDSDLTDEEGANRQSLANKRREAEAYTSYKHARQYEERDRDNDGVITDRDDVISDELSAILNDEDEKAALEDQWENAQLAVTTGEFDVPLEDSSPTNYNPLTRQQERGYYDMRPGSVYHFIRAETWEDRLSYFMRGDYEDPYPDEDLDPDNYKTLSKRERYVLWGKRKDREEKRQSKEQMIRYVTLKNIRTKEDYNKYTEKQSEERYHALVETHPKLVMAALREINVMTPARAIILTHETRIAAIEKVELHIQYPNAEVNEDGTIYIPNADVTIYPVDTLKEYATLFDADAYSTDEAEANKPTEFGLFKLTDEEIETNRDFLEEVEDQTRSGQWPPRIPLAIVEPMAGALHGFIPSHRQGDNCRVAVYNPLSAEIVGFQYRSDRKIGVGNVNATTGIVVEHDGGHGWSGLIFRNTEDKEISFSTINTGVTSGLEDTAHLSSDLGADEY